MIRLTAANGKLKWFNPEQITEVGPGVDETFVWIGDRSTTVRESAEEVARKVLEYKLAMVRYGMAVQASYQKELVELRGDPIVVCIGIGNQLHNLAGLEDTNE